MAHDSQLGLGVNLQTKHQNAFHLFVAGLNHITTPDLSSVISSLRAHIPTQLPLWKHASDLLQWKENTDQPDTDMSFIKTRLHKCEAFITQNNELLERTGQSHADSIVTHDVFVSVHT